MAISETDNNIQNNNDRILQAVNEIQGAYNVIENDESLDDNIEQLSGMQKAELNRFNNDTNLKKILTYFVISFASIWSVLIIILVYIVASVKFRFYLSDAVIITLMTETLCLVLGLPSIVVWHFFPKK